jgi:hypothetical protein
LGEDSARTPNQPPQPGQQNCVHPVKPLKPTSKHRPTRPPAFADRRSPHVPAPGPFASEVNGQSTPFVSCEKWVN